MDRWGRGAGLEKVSSHGPAVGHGPPRGRDSSLTPPSRTGAWGGQAAHLHSSPALLWSRPPLGSGPHHCGGSLAEPVVSSLYLSVRKNRPVVVRTLVTSG